MKIPLGQKTEVGYQKLFLLIILYFYDNFRNQHYSFQIKLEFVKFLFENPEIIWNNRV